MFTAAHSAPSTIKEKRWSWRNSMSSGGVPAEPVERPSACAVRAGALRDATGRG
ncbi:hypothetical protein HNR16_002853 [Pseudoclavibacter chungangensis]|nr:hypothetical protein [Pseudoclavibacter chungangensis]